GEDALTARGEARALGPREDRRVLEVLGDGGLHRVVLAHDPEHDEERPHRGDEVGVGDLPGAAMMAAAVALLLDDPDPDLFVVPAHAALFVAALRPASDSSLAGGRY